MRAKPGIHQILKISLGVSLSLLLIGCTGKPVPYWGGKLYNGWSPEEGLLRDNPPEPRDLISCREPRVNQMICMSHADFEAFKRTYVDGCKKWDVSSESLVEDYKLWEKIKPL